MMASCEVYWDRHIPLPNLAPLQARAAVALVALLCFGNSYDGEFVFDDSEAIVNNKVGPLSSTQPCVIPSCRAPVGFFFSAGGMVQLLFVFFCRI